MIGARHAAVDGHQSSAVIPKKANASRAVVWTWCGGILLWNRQRRQYTQCSDICEVRRQSRRRSGGSETRRGVVAEEALGRVIWRPEGGMTVSRQLIYPDFRKLRRFSVSTAYTARAANTIIAGSST